MISIQKLLGKDSVFFDLLEESAAEGLASAHALNRLLRNPNDKPAMEEFVKLRKKDKEITQAIAKRLVKTFVTTLEREDIEALSSALYKVPKTIEKFAERFLMVAHLLKDVDFSRHAYMIEQAAEHVLSMVKALRRGAHLEEIKELNGRMQQVEGDADKLILELYKDLYSGRYDPLKVLALKDLYEMLEKVIDRCRDAGNTVTIIVLKHS
jgi:uncharacterized protein Yka (UPF0111/DUF47 family)